MANRTYKQKAPRKRIENLLYVTSPYNDPAAVMATQTPGQPQRFGAPTAANIGSITFKQTQPLRYDKQTPAHATYPWYGYGEIGLDNYYNINGSYKGTNSVPVMGDWANKTAPHLGFGVEYTNKYNPRIDPYKRLTAKNSVVGFGAEIHSGNLVDKYDDDSAGAGFPVFVKPEITYRIPFKTHHSSGKRPTAYVNGVYGRYEDKGGLDVKAPVGLDIYGNLDAQYDIPYNDKRWRSPQSVHATYRDAAILPNDFNAGRTRLGTNIGARAQWDNGFSANLNAGAYYNPYNPSSKIIPVINAGVAYRYKDGGWLDNYK